MQHYKFFCNRECEYFPCHPGADPERFNCLFCYCPLYALGERCRGNFRYTDKGIKDCTNCLVPHDPENYDLYYDTSQNDIAFIIVDIIKKYKEMISE